MSDATHPPRDAKGSDPSRVVAFPRTQRPPERPPDNLPLGISSFVGREREMSEVKRLLGEGRFLTLTGPGGCGKTRLALEVARELAEEFEDGAWLVELASLSYPDLVPQTVASTLGLRETPGRSPTEVLMEHLKPRRMLLVLDNCEHLVEGCAVLADALKKEVDGVPARSSDISTTEPQGTTATPESRWDRENARAYFGGENKALIVAFIGLCEQGGLEVRRPA